MAFTPAVSESHSKPGNVRAHVKSTIPRWKKTGASVSPFTRLSDCFVVLVEITQLLYTELFWLPMHARLLVFRWILLRPSVTKTLWYLPWRQKQSGANMACLLLAAELVAAMHIFLSRAAGVIRKPFPSLDQSRRRMRRSVNSGDAIS